MALGYLRQDSSRKYRLGLGAVELGMAALNAMSLPAHAHPYMARLSRRAGHTVELAVLDGAETLLVHRVARTRNGTSEHGAELGGRRPAHRTSSGLVLLAYRAPPQRSRLIERLPLGASAPGMPSAREALEGELARVRRGGLAVQDNELTNDTCAIAAPVHDDTGDVAAALSIVAACHEIHADALAERFEDQLRATAGLISNRLGWPAGE